MSADFLDLSNYRLAADNEDVHAPYIRIDKGGPGKGVSVSYVEEAKPFKPQELTRMYFEGKPTSEYWIKIVPDLRYGSVIKFWHENVSHYASKLYAKGRWTVVPLNGNPALVNITRDQLASIVGPQQVQILIDTSLPEPEPEAEPQHPVGPAFAATRGPGLDSRLA